jgi:prephenate dehydrogenase
MDIPTLAIVGVGLIGGSVALAARQRQMARRVLGVGRSAETLRRARDAGMVDEVSQDLLAAATADVVVFCTPVDLIASQILALAPHCHPGTLITDAGSTKAALVGEIRGRLPAGVAFVGAHPLAGSEKQGPEHASADLFQGRLVVLTPWPADDPALARASAFWQGLGARIRVMSPEEHDRGLALTSHLPHLAASALAGLLPPELAGLTATGFRDATRIAAGDPRLWTAIFRANRGPLLEALARYAAHLEKFRAALTTEDFGLVEELLRQGKLARDQLGADR